MERGFIQLEQFIEHPPARVWEALTNPTIHAQWWVAGDVRPVLGHRFTLVDQRIETEFIDFAAERFAVCSVFFAKACNT